MVNGNLSFIDPDDEDNVAILDISTVSENDRVAVIRNEYGDPVVINLEAADELQDFIIEYDQTVYMDTDEGESVEVYIYDKA